MSSLPRNTLATSSLAILAIIVGAPLLALIVLALGGDRFLFDTGIMIDSAGVWDHVLKTALSRHIGVTMALMVGVATGVTIIGVGTGWLVTMYRFRGSKVLEWALLLPMAMPSYIIAFIYTDLLDFSGPVQVFLRETLGLDVAIGDIRSLTGAIVVMSLALYPYVYLFVRVGLLEQSETIFEAGRLLGCGPWSSVFRLGLPLIRPSLSVGLAVVMMETLNDFGTVDFFAVPTLSVGIYTAWLDLNSLTAAARLSLLALGFVVVVMALEHWGRRHRRYHQAARRHRCVTPILLSGRCGWLALIVASLPLISGFILPLAYLLLDVLTGAWPVQALSYAWNSFSLALAATVLTVVAGTIMALAAMAPSGLMKRGLLRLASIGYAMPGAVYAIGVSAVIGALSHQWDRIIAWPLAMTTMALTAVIYGYVARFLTIPYGSLSAALPRISPSMTDAARTLGCSLWQAIRLIHLPIVWRSLSIAVILVFVDCVKELPMTLMLRPFHYETLATWVWQYASDELFEQSAPGAFLIVIVGMLPVIALHYMVRQRQD